MVVECRGQKGGLTVRMCRERKVHRKEQERISRAKRVVGPTSFHLQTVKFWCGFPIA